jgi:hypothetical protein
MIRALIGAALVSCINAHKQREADKAIGRGCREIDLRQLTDSEVSDVVHGRRIDWEAVDRRSTARAAQQ